MRIRIRSSLVVFTLLACGRAGAAVPATAMPDAATREADVLLQQVEQATRTLAGFRCEASRSNISATRTATDVAQVTFLRPNFFNVVMKEGGGQRTYSVQSDGQAIYTVMDKTYARSGRVAADASGYHWFHNDLLVLLATGSMARVFEELPMTPRKRVLPDETWEGASYRVVELAIGGGYPITYKLYVGQDGFAHRLVQTDENNGKPLIFDNAIRALEPLTGKTAADFAFNPPADVKERDRGATAQRGVAEVAGPPTGVVGAMATEFALPTATGERVTLAAARQGKKALLLNFWFVHCPPCRAEHPELEKLYTELKDRGLGLLGIDDQDTPEDVTKYWTGARLTFPTILTGPRYERDPATGRQKYGTTMLADYASLQPYDVHACPTNILIDAAGRIVFRSSGWNEPELRAALAQLGIK
jgi:thiol-disulfide isomerase/thioredoxin